jgi:DNA ligase-1
LHLYDEEFAMSLFYHLAQLAEHLSTEPSRLAKRAAIAKAISNLALTNETPAHSRGEAIPPSITDLANAGLFALYLAGQPFPEADPRKLNTGGAILSRALKQAAQATDAALTAAYRRHGDLGAAAFDLLLPQALTTPTLTLAELANAFNTLATARTTASRSATVLDLLRRATPLEAKYLLKLMLGDMRIGVKQSLIEEAIAQASNTQPAAVRHAVMLEADLARALTFAFTNTLADARIRLFHPLGFMLASPVDTPEEAIAHLTKPSKNPKDHHAEGLSPSAQDAFIEDKYDGMRAQLHCGDPAYPNRVALYSRNREDITHSFPELTEAFASVTTPLILDGEILAWDIAANKALPFSILGQRIGRKKIDNTLRQQIPVIFMAFDILYAPNGDQPGILLLDHPLHTRRQRLETLATQLTPTTTSSLTAPIPETPQFHLFAPKATGDRGEEPGVPHLASEVWASTAATTPIPRLHLSPATLVTTAAAIDRAYTDARARANEGVMLKAANSHYLPGRRGLSWLKLKRELATLDVVITSAEYGHGKRAGLLSDYTFAILGPNAQLLNVGKAYSGLTDAEILALTDWLKAHTVEDHGHTRTVEPLRVLEVAFNNIMRSPRHASGFALRFPRILRIRDDKPATEIDTLARVEEIYQSQPDRPAEE